MIYCSECSAPVDLKSINTGAFERCHACGISSRTDVFPAYKTDISDNDVQEAVIVDDDASCFYHPKKKAVIFCSGCGRFLCALCDVEIDGEHLCFACMEAGKNKKQISDLETGRTIYDSLALRLALFPVVIFIFYSITIVTAPITLYLVVRHWRAPSSIVGRTKIRFIVAFILAFAQVATWAAGLYYIVNMT